MSKFVTVCLVTVLAAIGARADDAEDCMQDQDTKRQIRGCTEYIKRSNGTPEQLALAHFKRASAYRREGQIQLAKDDFDRAITLNPKDASSYVGRADVHEVFAQFFWNQDEFEKAALDFDRALKLIGSTAGADSRIRDFAESLRQRRDCDQGKDAPRRIKGCTDLLRSLRGAEQGAEFVYVNRGVAYEDQLVKDYGRAHADFDKAIFLNPKFVGAYLNRAALYRFEKQYARAGEDFANAAQLVEAMISLDPQLGAYAKSLREDVEGMTSYGRLEERWAEYLKEIQANQDCSNWMGKPCNPYDLYLKKRSPSRSSTPRS